MKKKLRAKREMLLALDDMKININGKGKIIGEFDDMQKELTGSFRKLEVDWNISINYYCYRNIIIVFITTIYEDFYLFVMIIIIIFFFK